MQLQGDSPKMVRGVVNTNRKPGTVSQYGCPSAFETIGLAPFDIEFDVRGLDAIQRFIQCDCLNRIRARRRNVRAGSTCIEADSSAL